VPADFSRSGWPRVQKVVQSTLNVLGEVSGEAFGVSRTRAKASRTGVFDRLIAANPMPNTSPAREQPAQNGGRSPGWGSSNVTLSLA